MEKEAVDYVMMDIEVLQLYLKSKRYLFSSVQVDRKFINK